MYFDTFWTLIDIYKNLVIKSVTRGASNTADSDKS